MSEAKARLPLAAQGAYAFWAAPLAVLYGAVTLLRRAAYDRGWLRATRLPGVTISVGNLVAGGTGKTPVVLELARLLVARGDSPAILTRGFGAGLRREDGLVVVDGAVVAARGGAALGAARVPDEAMLLSRSLPGVPVLVGADRRASAAHFMAFSAAKPSHWLLDDGFQHRRIARDVDLVLLDAQAPFANGALLPRGLLREPASSLARATAVLFTRAGDGFPTQTAKSRVAAFCSAQGEARFLTDVPAAPPPGRILLAAGVADPSRLQAAVESALGRPVSTHFVPDHADFAPAALKQAADGAALVLTTAKDHWRDPAVFAACASPVVTLGLRLEGVREFLQMLLGKPRNARA